MVELSKKHIFSETIFRGPFLNWGQIPAMVIFLTIIQNCIQKITFLYWVIRTPWAIKKGQKSKNIGAKVYVQSFTSRSRVIVWNTLITSLFNLMWMPQWGFGNYKLLNISMFILTLTFLYFWIKQIKFFPFLKCFNFWKIFKVKILLRFLN